MKTNIVWVVVLWIVSGAAAAQENNSSVSPLTTQANLAQPNDVTTIRTLGVCFPAPNYGYYSLANVVDPIVEAGYYLQQYEHRNFDFKHPSGTVSILQQPKHGILRLETEANHFGTGRFDPTNPGYAYLPEQGYLGKDSASVLVDVGGIKVKVKYYFQAVEAFFPSGDEAGALMEKLCGKRGTYWKISSTLDRTHFTQPPKNAVKVAG